MNKTRVLVTGANGFIGRNLFEAFSLRNDLEVFGTLHNNYTGWDRSMLSAHDFVDLTRKADALRVTKEIDVVIHAAAISAGAKYIVGQPDFLLDNTTINTNILQAVYQNNVKHFIFLSCSVLYPMNLGRPVREDDVDFHHGIHPKYHMSAWVKIYGEKLCEFYSKLGCTRFTVVRHSNIYGPHDKFDLERGHVTAATIAKVMSAKDGDVIMVWGTGEEERDLLYVSDFTNFVESVLDREGRRFDVFNVGLGKLISVAELTAKIINASGKRLYMKHDLSQPTIEDSKLVMDVTKAKEKLGWHPEIGLDEGIQQTLDWYKNNYKAPS